THPDMSAAAHYNLGNALFRQEKFQEAVGAYKKSLEIKPDDIDAKINLELALEKLDQDRQDKNQQDEQDKEQDQNRDQQDQSQNQDQNQQDQNQQDQNQQDQNQDQDQQDQNQDQDQQQGQQQGQQPDPREMTPEEAARILNAMKAREEESQKRRKLKLRGRRYDGNAW
ncbi:MAG: tetratricopeptide repeat protein, partial [Gemmatimonadota bacterium]|nr:tetratricopeptide repeat protein [Gemmatimonadota bacterium]